jgi:iron transport multicopper oxidase
MISGLSATVIENPLALQKTLKIPDDQMKACKDLGIPTAGNAAGNVNNPFDLSGANVPPKPLPSGFTPRGIVALVFSVVAAFIGLGVISWYGYAPVVKR